MHPGSAPQEWKQRQVNLPVQLVYPKSIVRRVAAANCELMAISEGNATIRIGTLTRIPDYFYLQFDFDENLIGCYVVGRRPGAIHCNFLREIDTAIVERIAARCEVNSVLESLWDDEDRFPQDRTSDP